MLQGYKTNLQEYNGFVILLSIVYMCCEKTL